MWLVQTILCFSETDLEQAPNNEDEEKVEVQPEKR